MKAISVRKRVLGAVFSLLLCLAAPLSLAQNTAAEPTEYVSNLTGIPENLMYPSVAEDSGLLYVIGGLVDDVGGFVPSSDRVYIYDIASGETTRGADMQYGTCWAEIAKGLDGNIYVFGGFNNSFGYMATTQIYDISADSWSLGAPCPDSRGGGSAVTVANGTMILIGAFGGSSVSTYLYDPVADSWAMMADQPVSVGARKATYWDESSIYVMGGASPSDTLYNFDPTANTWTELSPMPYASMMGGVASGNNGVVYHFGGVAGSWADTGSQLSQIQKYDPVADEWSLAQFSSLSPARSGFGYAEDSHGRIFVVGGYDGGSVIDLVSMIIPADVVFDELEIVDPTDGAIVDGVVTISVMYSTPDSGMPVIELWVDNVLVDTQTAPWFASTVEFLWDATALLAGSTHVITVRGTTWNGELREDTVTVTVSDQSTEEALAALQLQLATLQMQLNLMALAMEEANASTMAYLNAQLTILQAALTQIGAGLTAMGAGQTAAMDELNATLADLQLQLDAFQEQIDRVEDKADTAGTYGIVTMVLVIIVVVLVALMIMMARKKP